MLMHAVPVASAAVLRHDTVAAADMTLFCRSRSHNPLPTSDPDEDHMTGSLLASEHGPASAGVSGRGLHYRSSSSSELQLQQQPASSPQR
jgi:hypothetical protein